MNRVYLAGPIGGLTHDQCTEWRDYVLDRIDPRIECFCPMRGKHFLRSEGELTGGDYPGNPMSSASGIMSRDFNDVKRADVLFVNLRSAFVGNDGTRPSFGSVMEIAWAYAMQKPVVLIMEEGNLHEHVMIEQAASYIVENIDTGIQLTEALLLPDVQR